MELVYSKYMGEQMQWMREVLANIHEKMVLKFQKINKIAFVSFLVFLSKVLSYKSYQNTLMKKVEGENESNFGLI